MSEIKYPVQIQAAQSDAADSRVICMCHVFDGSGLSSVFNALTVSYCHVIAWDANGDKVREYDNR